MSSGELLSVSIVVEHAFQVPTGLSCLSSVSGRDSANQHATHSLGHRGGSRVSWFRRNYSRMLRLVQDRILRDTVEADLVVQMWTG